MIIKSNESGVRHTTRSLARASAVTLAISAILATGAVAAQPAKLPNLGADTARPISIPAGDLKAALELVTKQTGVELLFDTQQIKGIHTSGISGTLTTQEAVRRLVEGTRLELSTDASTGAMMIGEPARPTAYHSAGSEPESRESAVPPQNVRLAATDQSGQTESNETKVVPADSPNMGSRSETTTDCSDPRNRSDSSCKAKLEEIVVTGTNIRGVAPTSPVTVLDRRYIELSGRATVADVIRTLPQNFNGGENVGNIGAGAANQGLTGGSSPNLRGLGTGSTLTLINGRRLAFAGYQGGPDISVVPLAAVDRIEVVTDGASALYGSDAVAGVVNIRLRSDFTGAETRLRFGGASHGGAAQPQFSQVFGTSWSSGNVVGSYEYNKTGNLLVSERPYSRSLSDKPYTLLPAQDRHSVFGAVRQDITPGLKFMTEGLFSSRSSVSLQSDPYSYGTDGYRVKQYSVTSGLEAEFGQGWNGSLYVTQANDKDNGHGLYTSIGSPTTAYDYPYRNRTRVVEGQASGRLFDLPAGAVQLAAGAGYKDELWYSASGSGGVFSSETNASRNSKYGFAELRVPVLAKASGGSNLLEATLAARYEDFSDSGNTVNPKVGLILRPDSQFVFKGSWGTSFRAPELYRQFGGTQINLETLATTPPSGKTTFLLQYGSNPDITPEKSQSWNVSAEYNPEWQRNLTVKAAGFLINYKDRIDFPYTPYFVPLNDPTTYAQYFTNDPTVAQLNAAIGGERIVSYDGSVYDPANVAFILDSRYKNIGKVQAKGLDFEVDYAAELGAGHLDLITSVSWLREELRATPALPLEVRTGTIFNPPKLRGRAGASWQRNTVTASAMVNYTDALKNNRSLTQTSIASWTTLDLQLSFAPQWQSWMQGLQVRLDVQNALDKDPPAVREDSFFFLTGLGFDPTNASAIGRFGSVEVIKRW